MEGISLLSLPSAIHSPPEKGKLHTPALSCSGGSWSPLAFVLLVHCINGGWRHGLGLEAKPAWRQVCHLTKYLLFLHLRQAAASFSIPNPVAWGCQLIHLLAPEKAPHFLCSFQRWREFSLKLASGKRWKLAWYFLHCSCSVVICDLLYPDAYEFLLYKCTWKFFQHLLMNPLQ